MARKSELRFANFNGVENIFGFQLHDGGVSGIPHHNSLPIHLQRSLEKKLRNIVNNLARSRGEIFFLEWEALARKMLMEAELRFPGRKSTNEWQALLKHKLVNTTTHVARDTDWVPLIKAVATSATFTATRPTDRSACAEKEAGRCDGFALSGRSVLCVGGRAALYPEYRRTVETSGGKFLLYRGDLCDDAPRLSAMLACADAVVCPVDCVNHEAYFTVKRYCKYSGKPCALLERSDLFTFRPAVPTDSPAQTDAFNLYLTAKASTTPKIRPMRRASSRRGLCRLDPLPMAAAKESVDIARASIIKEEGLTIFYFRPAAGMDKLFSDAAAT
jgi:hypothetical protein